MKYWCVWIRYVNNETDTDGESTKVGSGVICEAFACYSCSRIVKVFGCIASASSGFSLRHEGMDRVESEA